MTAVKRSISLPKEVLDAVDCIALAQGVARSRVIDTFLRENQLVQQQIEAMRMEPETGVLSISRRMISEVRQRQEQRVPTPVSA